MEARSLDWLRVRVRERGHLAGGDAEALRDCTATSLSADTLAPGGSWKSGALELEEAIRFTRS